eukprot:29206-Pelagococcus_subviridis.AAC.1
MTTRLALASRTLARASAFVRRFARARSPTRASARSATVTLARVCSVPSSPSPSPAPARRRNAAASSGRGFIRSGPFHTSERRGGVERRQKRS